MSLHLLVTMPGTVSRFVLLRANPHWKLVLGLLPGITVGKMREFLEAQPMSIVGVVGSGKLPKTWKSSLKTVKREKHY